MHSQKLEKGKDYYLDTQGRMVFTEFYHLKRGHCCRSACRHCPYGFALDPSVPAELHDPWDELSLEEQAERYLKNES